MRRVFVMILVVMTMVIPSMFLNGCSSRNEISDLFESFPVETSEKIPYVYYDSLVFGDVELDFGSLLQENNIDGTFCEVYAIQNDLVYFSYSANTRTENGGKTWHIATVTVDKKEISSIYCADFCVESGSDQHYYVKNNNDHSQNRYLTANGFYYDGKIVLTDHVKLVEFDLNARSAVEFSAKDYLYPTVLDVEIVDAQTIKFSKDAQQKTFDTDRGKATSSAFAEMLKLEDEKAWDGDSLLFDLFNKVQIVDNQIFIMCRVINWHGETHAVVYRYNFEDNSCQYAFHCFMDDVIRNKLYVAPVLLGA